MAAMMTPILSVAVGGALGSVLRYAMGTAMTAHAAAAWGSRFPLGTFAVNLLGSLLIGLVAGMADKHAALCLLYTSPSPRDQRGSRMPSSA